MKKLCVIARNFETYFTQRLSEEVGNKVSFCNVWEGEKLPQADIYFFRPPTMREGNAVQIPKARTLINPLSSFENFPSKVHQYQCWEENRISVLPWMALNSGEKKAAEAFFQDQLGQSAIVKPQRGQQGWGVAKLVGEEFVSWLEKQSEKGDLDYLLQQYVEGSEIRVFFIDQKTWVLERKKGRGVAANFSQDGIAKIIKMPQGLSPLFEHIFKLSGAFYGAVDFIYDGGTYWPLDLNLSPGIEQLEQVSGENIIGELLFSLNSGNLKR